MSGKCKEITVLSGKGGAGKTSITAALASVSRNAVFCDNDVDASDLHLLLNPQVQKTSVYVSGYTPQIDQEKCVACGECQSNCRFGAIECKENGFFVNSFLCEGCKLCEKVCVHRAISMVENNNNHWYIAETRFGKMVYAKMKPGEENSGKLVTLIRKESKIFCEQLQADYLLNDGPPGIGCSTISSITGTDCVLLVVEPTIAGIHDVKRLVELVEKFGVPMVAVINKYDLFEEGSAEIEAFLQARTIPLIGKIAFDKRMVDALVAGKTIVEYSPKCAVASEIRTVWNRLEKELITNHNNLI